MLKNILIIDDEEKLRHLLARIIKSEGFEVFEASDLKSGFKKLEANDIDVVLCDVKLPDGNGVDFLQKIKATFPLSEVILLTAFGKISDGVQAMKNGAFDYIVKGDDNDKIIPLLYKALEKVQLQKKVKQLEKRISDKYSFDNIIGKSKGLEQVIDLAKKVSKTDSTVLLTGETGTGKEVFAQAIHENSNRVGKTFVALNCSTFSKEILESELFGHKQGAFTGAIKDKKGFIEEANGGTLFLDEIGEMPLELQAKLLRVLETSEYIQIGDTTPRKSNFRLIAATNRDLKKESDEHHFRSDLYFRLNIFEIKIPPLRERIKDIAPLTNYFVEQFASRGNKKRLSIDTNFMSKLETYHWPGNVRELRNVIERSVILVNGEILTQDVLPYEIQHQIDNTNKTLSAFSMQSVEKLHIQKVLNYTKGNKAEASRLLEIGIATLYRKLDEYNIQ
ncbi:sigma-54-dependent Fis family transcriptional regulator [Flavobacterium psychrophilum]|uniref:sigma-54-dependent transcriptional regulator n=1 Tax=Flavobacterium psychrophilum TaxID=96345 RepID=UPI00138DD65C|nr:sigma-54 dependent transcriptional regulator [Flavobacterium psychrophilum]EKT2068337.1 sigma-54-dependent Fis family transcriptional regulator [Flavobacterium psychrophilum]EKT2071415.1 sigma-54-dependent Fis family transcriptional regulator [Flavobacterium psychrophilum]EKT3957074.1 sigma-54-dependent Fis family transcriptional regulator [Flavobacterium psychrophilum]EKT3965044.1 sigma-54-dependent Fis family transcriptional regulator [Flavobacterium psychrophilum]EKT4490936.1 sigma-54-de